MYDICTRRYTELDMTFEEIEEIKLRRCKEELKKLEKEVDTE